MTELSLTPKFKFEYNKNPTKIILSMKFTNVNPFNKKIQKNINKSVLNTIKKGDFIYLFSDINL